MCAIELKENNRDDIIIIIISICRSLALALFVVRDVLSLSPACGFLSKGREVE